SFSRRHRVCNKHAVTGYGCLQSRYEGFNEIMVEAVKTHHRKRKRQSRRIPELQLALEGKLEEHHRFLLELQLQRLEAAEKDLAALEQRIRQKLEPYAAQLALLDEIPGVDWTLAAVIIAELGVDMSVFGSV